MSRTERADLCDAALQLGEDQPTLCGTWSVKELVVHLLIRERNIAAAPGILVPPLARLTDRATRRLNDGTDFTVLVERLRQGPPLYSPLGWGPVDAVANAIEFFVHHEDIRRAQPEWTARTLSRREESTLWARLTVLGRAIVRGSDVGIVLERSDTGARAVLRSAPNSVVVRGLPGELALFTFGRREQAHVELDGSPEDIAALRGTDLSL